LNDASPHYNDKMEYIVEQGLPPASLAAQLAQSLKQTQPNLNKLFSACKPSQSKYEPQVVGCTPYEARVLSLNGWSQNISKTPGQALASWQLDVTQSTAPVWAAQLCSTQIGTSVASLRPLSLLDLSLEEAQSLCEAAMPSFGQPGDAIWVEALTPTTWRVHAPLAELAHTVSPEALAGQNIAGWWPDGDAWLAWRRILNEIQMVWHNHPVNESRLEQGLSPVNGVWLYGGSQGWQPNTVSQGPLHTKTQTQTHPQSHSSLPSKSQKPAQATQQSYELINTLRPYVMTSDWSGWLDAWLKEVLPLLIEMQTRSTNTSSPTLLTLTGHDRLVTLSPLNQNQPNWLKKLTQPFTQNDWSTWWHNPS
jgi:hypothetical protein